MAEEKKNDKLPADDSHRVKLERKQTSGKLYEAHGNTANPKRKCTNCNPDRPQPNDILERAMHFDVNAKGRKCTDCYCCLLYILFLVAWVGVFGVALHFGSVFALVYGRDYQKNICGVYNPVKEHRWWAPPEHKWGLQHPTNFLDKKYLYYPRLSDDLIDYAIRVGTTVKDLDIFNMDIDSLMNITLMGVCTNRCPTYGQIICTNDFDLKIRTACRQENIKDWDTSTHTQKETMFEACKKKQAGNAEQCRGGELLFGLIKNPFYYMNTELCTNCWVTPINTTDIFYRCLEIIWTQNTKVEKCIFPKNEKYDETLKKNVPMEPTDKGYLLATDEECITKEVVVEDFSERPAYENPVAELLGDTLMTLQGWLRDCYNSILVIVICGCGAAIILGFLWIFLLRWFTKPIVWGTIVGFLLVLFLGCAWSWLNTGWVPSPILAEWLANTFSTWGISHPALDYIVNNLNSTADKGNFTVPDNAITQTAFNSLPEEYNLSSVEGIKVETLWQVAAIASSILFVAGIVAVALLAKKIAIAIAIIEEAAIAIMRMPHMVFLPFGTAFCIMVLFFWFISLGALIKSLDEVRVSDIVASVTGWLEDNVVSGSCNTTVVNSTLELKVHAAVDEKTQWLADQAAGYACSGVTYFKRWDEQRVNDILLVFHLFCFLWTNELFQAITICTVAGAVCDWYWTRPSGPKRALKTDCCYKIPCCRSHGPDPDKAYKGGDGKSFQTPILRSFCRTMRFHLGSLAFGSFLVAVVQLIRIAFEYLKKETKGWAQKNKCFKIMFKVITCILCLFEKCLKFITKNAYIMVAMQGHAFCDSCCHAFKLLLTNLIQFVLVSCFSKVVILLGKVFITGTSVVGAYFWLAQDSRFQEYTPRSVNDPPDHPDGITGTSVVNNKIIPVVLVGFLGYSFAAAFLHVYDLAIATILLCFCEDYKVHQVGDPHFPELHKEVYMPNSLRRIVLSPDEFQHMQKPLTQEQIMNMAGVDTRSDGEKEILSYDEIIAVAKKLFLKSNEFLHLHKSPEELTDKDIVDATGGDELWAELKRPNPMYDKEFALDVSAGRAMVKEGFHDRRLEKYQPDLTHADLIELIARANKLHEHLEPMTQEAVVNMAAEKHGEAYASMMNETPSRQRIASMSSKAKGGDPKVLPGTSETPVQNAASIRQQNEKKPLVEEEIL